MPLKTKPKKVENESALKHLFDQSLLKRIADSIHNVEPSFDRKHFIGLMPQLRSLEMKSRVRLLRDALKKLLPEEYPKALKILLASLKDGKLNGFDLWPYTEFVQTYGLQDFEVSLPALREITPRFTSEWGVRPFISTHPKPAMKFLLACASDKDAHVRRWASEGSRPRLPWGERLHQFIKDPSPTLPILEKLKFDPELYVRKSVSNHLNDIAKDHPDLVIQILKRWKKQAGANEAEKIDWIIHRSLRTLIKNGHPEALGLIGVSDQAQLKFSEFKILQKKIKLGERLEFDFVLNSSSSKAQKLVVDYIVHFVKANRSTAPKVFKLKTFVLGPKQSLKILKRHHLKRTTTRGYYSGPHILEIQVNGKIFGKMAWDLDAW